MNEDEKELLHLLEWVAEHDTDAHNAAYDLVDLVLPGGHGLDAGMIWNAIFEEEDDFRASEPSTTPFGPMAILLDHLYWRISLVRAALPAYLARSNTMGESV